MSFGSTWVSVALNIFEISDAEIQRDSRAPNQHISRDRLIINEEQKSLLITIKNSPYSNEIATEWKGARAVPVFQAGIKGKLGNCRAFISMSVICKIMETIAG